MLLAAAMLAAPMLASRSRGGFSLKGGGNGQAALDEPQSVGLAKFRDGALWQVQ